MDLDPRWEWCETMAFGRSEPRYIKVRCNHLDTVPVDLLTGEVVARLCLTCDASLPPSAADVPLTHDHGPELNCQACYQSEPPQFAAQAPQSRRIAGEQPGRRRLALYDPSDCRHGCNGSPCGSEECTFTCHPEDADTCPQCGSEDYIPLEFDGRGEPDFGGLKRCEECGEEWA